jgi:hypothetical protein
MNASTPEAEPVAPSSGQIDSWRDFQARVEAGMAMLAAEPVDVLLVDPDFVKWPLGGRAVMAAFDQWALGSTRRYLTVLAADFDSMPRNHPRWVAWRSRWSHRVRCMQAPPDLCREVRTTLVLGSVLAMRVIEPRLGRGLWTRDVDQIAAWRMEADVILQRSSEAFPPTTLGL